MKEIEVKPAGPEPQTVYREEGFISSETWTIIMVVCSMIFGYCIGVMFG